MFLCFNCQPTCQRTEETLYTTMSVKLTKHDGQNMQSPTCSHQHAVTNMQSPTCRNHVLWFWWNCFFPTNVVLLLQYALTLLQKNNDNDIDEQFSPSLFDLSNNTWSKGTFGSYLYHLKAFQWWRSTFVNVREQCCTNDSSEINNLNISVP